MPIYLDKGNRSDISYIWWFYNELQVFVLNPDIHYILIGSEGKMLTLQWATFKKFFWDKYLAKR